MLIHYNFPSNPQHSLKHFCSKDLSSIITTKKQYFSGSYFCFNQQCFFIEVKVCDTKINSKLNILPKTLYRSAFQFESF